MPNNVVITDRKGLIISTDINFSSYSFASEVLSITDSFQLVLADSTVDTSNWYGVQLRVDNIAVFDGTTQVDNPRLSPGVRDLSLSGKDRGKFLDETFCSKFTDFENTPPKDIVNALIDQTQFYGQPTSNYSSIIPEPDWDDPQQIAEYNTAIINDIKENKAFIKSNNKTIFDSNFEALANKKSFKIQVGDTVGDKLIDLVRSVGMDIFYRQDGSLFFGKLDNLRDSTSKTHTLILTENDRGNNVLDADIIRDNSGRYSDITVISQNQNAVNTSATATDSSVIDKRTMIVPINDDETSPQQEAIRIRNDQLVESFNATYTVSGHTDPDSGDPWTLNRTVRMNDEVHNVIGDYVLYSVSFNFDKEGDAFTTTLGISHPRNPGLNI